MFSCSGHCSLGDYVVVTTAGVFGHPMMLELVMPSDVEQTLVYVKEMDWRCGLVVEGEVVAVDRHPRSGLYCLIITNKSGKT